MLEILKDRIEQGIYPVESRLPSERKLAVEYGVPQSRIHKTLQELTARGYLECRRGSGYFVRPGRPGGDARRYRVAFCCNNAKIVSTIEDFYTELFFALSSSYSIDLSFFTMPHTREEQNRLIMRLINDRFEGVFAFPHYVTELSQGFLDLKKQGIPLIFWDFSPLPGVFPAVGVDHFATCFRAAEILAGQAEPVTYIGFREQPQNHLKLSGFQAGARAFGTEIEDCVLLSYDDCPKIHTAWPERILRPGRLYFTSTRILSYQLIGRLLDLGRRPGRDYRILTTDWLQFMEGSGQQLDCMLRDSARVIRKLLFEMRRAVRREQLLCNDYRIPMNYISGMSLRHR